MGRIFGIVCLLVLGCLVQLGTAMAAPEGPRVAVLELQGSGLSREMVALLSDKVREGVLASTRGQNVTIMSRENMAVIAKDMGLDLACIEGECEVETGRNIGAAYVVSGGVVDVGGGLWICTIKIHRTDSGALLATGDVRGGQPADLIDEISPRVQGLMTDAFGGGGSQSTVQLGGEAVDFAGQAAAAGRAGAGGVADVGEATLELGSGGGDIAALVAQAQAKKAQRERLAAEEAELQARLKAAQNRELGKAKSALIEQARADYAPLAALLQGPMSDRTVSVLKQYLRRYSGATVKVNGETSLVVVPDLARIERAMDREETRRETETRRALDKKIDAARQTILAQAAQDYAALKPLLGSAATADTRPALQAFVSRYGDARIRVDDVRVEVDVPGVTEVRRTLGLREQRRRNQFSAVPPGKKSRGRGIAKRGDPIILGALDKSLIDRVIKQNMRGISACYRRELKNDRYFGGKIVVKLVIASDGSVSKSSTKSSTLRNSAVESCINNRFMTFKFPKPKGGGIVIVSYPFLFS